MRVRLDEVYSGAEGPSEDGPINWLLPVCQGKQPLITPAVVFMLLHASTLHHPVAFALCMTNLRLCSLCYYCTTTLCCCHPPFLITFTLFSLWKNEMGHSAAAAFQHYPHADIPLHKPCLSAVPLHVSVHVFVFFTLLLCCVALETSRVLLSRLSGFKQIKVSLQPRWYQQSWPLKKEQNPQKRIQT